MPPAFPDITFNRPAIVGRELQYIHEAVKAMQISGDGGFTRRCSALLCDMLGVDTVQLTTSCTDALEMCAILLDIQPGDEVVVPAYSFVSSINAFVLRGARPVFSDVRPDTLNLDESALEGLLTPRTRAIVVVHYAGVGCEMDAILEIASRRGIPVVEDNAHGLFGRYRGKYLGTFGCLATQSFHETKNFTCGEGGALLVNDASLRRRAEIIRDKGTNRQELFRGEVDKYTWVDIGSSFALSDLLAAFLFAQLERHEEIVARRSQLWETYDRAFRGVLDRHGVDLPHVPEHCDQAHHMYYLMLPSLAIRQRLIGHLRASGIVSVFHYTPLHLSRMGVGYGGREGQCPVTERAGDCLTRLPLFHDLEPAAQQRVIVEVLRFFEEQPS